MPQRDDVFTGGHLAGVAFELDAKFYGAAHENTRRFREWGERNAANVARQTAEGMEEPVDLPRPAALCTWEWIAELGQLDAPESTSNPFAAINFRLDVLRALSTLPKSHLAAFVALMDGYGVEGLRIDLDEIARVMAPEGGRPWDTSSVRNALKKANRTVRRDGAPIVTKMSAACAAESEIHRIRGERARFQAKSSPNRTKTSQNRPKRRLEQLEWPFLPPS